MTTQRPLPDTTVVLRDASNQPVSTPLVLTQSDFSWDNANEEAAAGPLKLVFGSYTPTPGPTYLAGPETLFQSGGSIHVDAGALGSRQRWVEICWKVTLAEIDSSLDTNPHTGGGLRIFPCKQSLTDTTARNTVKIQVTGAANTVYYYKAVDVDDPSTDAAPVDTNGDLGEDNIGTQSVTGEITTDGSGFGEASFTVSWNAGDNWVFVVSPDRGQAHFATDTGGGALTFGGGAEIPASARTEMLTVWRKLYVEVDSMGTPAPSVEFDDGTNSCSYPATPTPGGTPLVPEPNPADDPHPGDIADPDISRLAETFDDAYVAIDTTVLASFNSSSCLFARGWESSAARLLHSEVHRHRPYSQDDGQFYAVQIMGAYELGTVYDEAVPFRWPDNDPDCDRAVAGKMENGTSLVFHEKVRDWAAQHGWSPAERQLAEQFVVVHEVAHAFIELHDYTSSGPPPSIMWAPEGGDSDESRVILIPTPFAFNQSDIRTIRAHGNKRVME